MNGIVGRREAKYEREGITTHAASFDSPDSLFRTHYARLVSSLAAASGDEDSAADAVQEAFVQLWKRWDEIRLYEDPVGWVRRVAVNRLHNRRRSLVRRASALLRLAPDTHASPAAAEPQDPAILVAFRMLPSRQRLAMALHYVADLSLREVAKSMGISEGAVKQHLHRGRESLRRRLEVEQ